MLNSIYRFFARLVLEDPRCLDEPTRENQVESPTFPRTSDNHRVFGSVNTDSDQSVCSVTINGKTYSGTNSIKITNDSVFIDNNEVVMPVERDIRISVKGNIELLHVYSCNLVSIDGDVSVVTTASGNVECKDVLGNVKTVSGDVDCGDVATSVTTVSGDVRAKSIGSASSVSGMIKP